MKMTKKERSWILYDCGNSAYSMAVTTAFLPIYFGMFREGSNMDIGYFNSIASILVAILSPILGTFADYKGMKKKFFTFFALLGIVFTGALALVPIGQWQILIGFYILNSIGFAGANIFYDSFIVDVTDNDKMDDVSSKGFAFGYIASVIPFMASLSLVYILGMDKFIGYQLAFVITAIWWGLFTLPMIKNVTQEHYIEPEANPIANSFKRLGKTFLEIKKHKIVFTFIIAYFLYIDGVDTIIKMAIPYAGTVIGADAEGMMVMLGILLIIQFVAFPCAIIYGKLANRYSSKTMLVIGILTYVVATIYAFNMNSVMDMFVLGCMIGTAQGGVQALSRSYYAKIIPKKQSNEFFGFYNVFGKFAAIVGPTAMALTATITGNVRVSILAIVPLFIAGLIILLTLPKEPSEHTN